MCPSTCSVQALSEGGDTALLVGLLGAPDLFLEQNRLITVAGSDTAIARVMARGPAAGCLSWCAAAGGGSSGGGSSGTGGSEAGPGDWQQLVAATELAFLVGSPLVMGSTPVGLLTLGFKSERQGEDSM